MKFPRDPKTGAALGYEIPLLGAELVATGVTDIDSALEAVQQVMMPASPSDIAMWIVELWQVVQHTRKGELESRALIAAYSARLLRYPGDLVHDALKQWSGQFFPTWAELAKLLEERVAWRRMLHEAVVAARGHREIGSI